MPTYPVYATLRIFLGAVEATSKEAAEEIANSPHFPWPVKEWESILSIEAEEPDE